jgi:hypothetical protein
VCDEGLRSQRFTLFRTIVVDVINREKLIGRLKTTDAHAAQELYNLATTLLIEDGNLSIGAIFAVCVQAVLGRF